MHLTGSVKNWRIRLGNAYGTGELQKDTRPEVKKHSNIPIA